MERWAPPAFHSFRSFLSPDPNSRSKPRREGYHRGNHVWGPNRLYTHPSPGTVCSLSDCLAGMAELQEHWKPRPCPHSKFLVSTCSSQGIKGTQRYRHHSLSKTTPKQGVKRRTETVEAFS